MPFCPECGSPFESGQDFCRSCGASLKGIEPDAPQPASLRPVTAGMKPRVSPSAKPVQSRPGPRTAIPRSALVIGLIGIFLIIGVAAFFVLTGSPGPAGAQNNTSAGPGPVVRPINNQCSEGMTLCRGNCVNLLTDSNNCGGCGFSVPFGETCIQGKFSGSLGRDTNSSSPTPATTTPSHPTGTTITGSPVTPPDTTPVTPAATQTSCRSGLTLCGGYCKDLQTDSRNCGSCWFVCPTGESCQNAWCLEAGKGSNTGSSGAVPDGVSCETGQTLCSNSCVDLFTNRKNCGVCGRSCGTTEICVNARCGPACTGSGTTLCNDKCVDLDTDMENCGTCGTECETFLPNAKGSLCSSGECKISGCKTDYADCDKNVANGCEVYLRNSAANCGSCGKTCLSGQVCYNMKCSKPATT